MKKITAEDLFPMRVNPSNFTRNDVVKKIYMDNITTPYVGVVTSVIPSTNKVEVQWPYGTGLEDPWDLIKVNPILNPPVVREDKAYKTYQNQKAQKYNEDHVKELSHYNVLNDFIQENVSPVIMRVSSYYNSGFPKRKAFIEASKHFDNSEILKNVISKVYSDNVEFFEKSYELDMEGSKKIANISILGNSDNGFTLKYALDLVTQDELFFDNYQDAFKTFKSYEELISKNSTNNEKEYAEVVSKLANISETNNYFGGPVKVVSDNLNVRIAKLKDDLVTFDRDLYRKE